MEEQKKKKKKVKPTCKLTGTDGNVFSVMSTVRKTLQQAKKPKTAHKFIQEAMRASSYGEVFSIAEKYVKVE